jgi:putative pyrroloquinoline-quinone binding quinoprotein
MIWLNRGAGFVSSVSAGRGRPLLRHRANRTDRTVRHITQWPWESGVAYRTVAVLAAGVVLTSTGATGTVGSKTALAPHSKRIWVARFDGRAHAEDSGFLGIVSPDGSKVFVTGGSVGRGGSVDAVTIAYRASSGKRIWIARYDGPGRGDDFGQALATSADGKTLFVHGSSTGDGTGLDWATIAYDAKTGHRIWVRRLDGLGHGNDFAQGGIAVSSEGSGVVASGQVTNADASWDVATVSYDPETGTRQWFATYDGPVHGNDAGNSLIVGPNNTAYVTGLSTGENSGYDIATIAYDAETGKMRWSARYNGPGNGADIPCYVDCIKLNGDGSRAYLTGQSYGGATGDDFITLSYETDDGELLWASRYDGSTGGTDLGWDLVVLADGSRVVVNGQSAPGSGDLGNSDIALISYEGSTGAEQWVTTYDGPAHGDDASYGSGRTPEGDKVMVTGPSEGLNSGYDIVTLAFDTATGARLWVDRYDGPAHGPDNGYWLTVAPGGASAFVVGDSTGATSLDYLTLAFRLK